MNRCALPSEVDQITAEERVIAEKTAFWQQEPWAVRHLKHSGVRPGPSFLPIFTKILSLLPEHARILDVGCGHGRLSIPLAEAGYTVVATDVSANMLAILQQNRGDLPIEIRPGDAHQLAAADGEFDVVLSADFMPHFPDWPRLLKEQARVCKIGGRVIFGFNFSEHRTFAEPMGGDAFEHPYSREVHSAKPFWAECSVAEMTIAAAAAGLKLVAAYPLKFLLDNYAFGGALGAEAYREFQGEFTRRLEENPAVADFYSWLEHRLFQRLPFFAAYHSLVVLERVGPGQLPPDAISDAAGRLARSSRIAVVGPAERDAFLSAIPSETSLAERRLLFELFSKQWDGNGAVVEIGPFLGGTTRAIAWGMAQNPRLGATSRLHTFDRFGAYHSPAGLRQLTEPLVVAGTLAPHEADALCQSGDFLRLFDTVHSPHDYYRLVQTHSVALPELPAEVDTCQALVALNQASDLGALFIDGCKSWASTLYAMRFLLPRTRAGAPLIFQDYGWYTCFWISAFAFALEDKVELEQAVDSTYVFRLKEHVSAAEVSRRFAKSPHEMGADFFKKACLSAMRSSLARSDGRGGLVAQLHLVAALATVGRKAEAARILEKLDPKNFGQLGYMIEGSRKSPTYGPGNRPLLWTEG